MNKGCLSISYQLQSPKLSANIHLRQRLLHPPHIMPQPVQLIDNCGSYCSLRAGTRKQNWPNCLNGHFFCSEQQMQSLPLHLVPTINDKCHKNILTQPIKVVKYRPEIFTSCDTRIRQDCNTTIRSGAPLPHTKCYLQIFPHIREVPKNVCEERLTLRCYEVIK